MTGFTTVLDSIVKHDGGDGTWSAMLNGEPHASAIVDAVTHHYHTFTGRQRPTEADFIVGEKVSILTHSENMLGASSLTTLAGTVFEGARGLAVLPKGKRKNGYSLSSMLAKGTVLDVEPDYAGEKLLSNRVNFVRTCMPRLEPLTQDHLNALPSRSNTCSLAVFGTYPFMGDRVPGCVWFIESYLKGDDILDNTLIIDPQFGYSEHGSVYGRDLLRWPVGAVVGFPTIPLSEALDLTNAPYVKVLEALR